MSEKKLWIGEVKECDCCKMRGVSDASIKGKTMYDAPFQSLGGTWMNFCRNCYNTYAYKGIGQMYKKDENGNWVKSKNLTKTRRSVSCDEQLLRMLGF